jgi:hypothetical protein
MFASEIFETNHLRKPNQDTLDEGAKEDLDVARKAERIATQFGMWLAMHNEDKPLAEIGFTEMHIMDNICCVISASKVGIDLPNVFFGFSQDGKGWRNKRSGTSPNAVVCRFPNGGVDRPLFLISIVHGFDPIFATDVTWKLSPNNHNVMVHEIIHILDMRRGLLKRNPVNGKTQTQYFNSDHEFNAYYEQGVSKFLQGLLRYTRDDQGRHSFRIKYLSSFQNFSFFAMHDFNTNWMHHFSPTTKKKFMKRLFKLYALMTQEWPNMDVIRDREKELEEIEAAWEVEYARRDALKAKQVA